MGTENTPSLRAWVGRTEERRDLLAPSALARLRAVLDRAPDEPGLGDALWHWLLFRDAVGQSELGVDGHPPRGTFLPPIRLPRRMYAGFRLEHHRPPATRRELRRRSTVTAVDEKEGSTGPLVFVTVEHRVLQDDTELAVEEEDLVFTGGPPPAGAAGSSGAIPDAPLARDLDPDPALLFRFSAVTFNAHRIHYDRSYATDVEGYPGLVVHGPLIAALLCDLATPVAGTQRVERVAFRARRPVFEGERLHLRGWPRQDAHPVELAAYRQDGQVAASAELTLADRLESD